MDKGLKVKLNSEAVVRLLRSRQMMDICKQLAYDAQSRLGNGYIVSCKKGKTRVNASIKANTSKAKKDNLENNTILKALR